MSTLFGDQKELKSDAEFFYAFSIFFSFGWMNVRLVQTLRIFMKFVTCVLTTGLNVAKRHLLKDEKKTITKKKHEG